MSVTMRRTKVKNVSSKPSMTNAATQTIDLDAHLEIAKLQEQLKLLQLEIDVLRRHMHTPQKLYATRSISPRPAAQATPKINKERSVCGCKGDCLTKRCSCVKKNSKCDSSCKCSDDVCQNRNQEQENKENVNKENTGTVQKQVRTKRNEFAKKIKDNNTQDDKIMNNENVVFDPMVPKHQLSRTPPSCKRSINEKSRMLDNTIRTPSYEPLHQREIKSFNIKDIKEEEEIDWEQHTAQLVPCKKCKRTFMPDRIQKHEACCKKI